MLQLLKQYIEKFEDLKKIDEQRRKLSYSCPSGSCWNRLAIADETVSLHKLSLINTLPRKMCDK
jgi:hypothetical protein